MRVSYPPPTTKIPQSEAYTKLVSSLENNNLVFLKIDKRLSNNKEGDRLLLDFNPDLNNLFEKTTARFTLSEDDQKNVYLCNAQFAKFEEVSRRKCRKLVCILTDKSSLLKVESVYNDRETRERPPSKRPRQEEPAPQPEKHQKEEEEPVMVTDDVDLTSEYQLEAVRQLVNNPKIQKIAVRKVILDLKPAHVDLLARESSQQYRTFLKGLAAYSFIQDDTRNTLFEIVKGVISEDPHFATRIINLSTQTSLNRFTLPGNK